MAQLVGSFLLLVNLSLRYACWRFNVDLSVLNVPRDVVFDWSKRSILAEIVTDLLDVCPLSFRGQSLYFHVRLLQEVSWILFVQVSAFLKLISHRLLLFLHYYVFAVTFSEVKTSSFLCYLWSRLGYISVAAFGYFSTPCWLSGGN